MVKLLINYEDSIWVKQKHPKGGRDRLEQFPYILYAQMIDTRDFQKMRVIGAK